MSPGRTWIVPVGGFLGAGKTSLIVAAAKLLQERGFKAAAILNDQGGELVDTAFVASHGVLANEVAGACFCCRYSELMSVVEQFRDLSPDVVFIEPVGSCIDLAATVMQPMLRDAQGTYEVAPLTVLVDPARPLELTGSDGDEHLSYLFHRQIAEADLVVRSKCDRPSEFPALKRSGVRQLSAKTGEGVGEWLDEVLSGTLDVGRRLLDINYEQYAQAEAALGWLNWSASVTLERLASPAELIGPLLDNLQEALCSEKAVIVHLKVLDQAGGCYVKAAVAANDDEPIVEGDLSASPEWKHTIRVNIRAMIHPAELDALFRREAGKIPGRWAHETYQCFSPAAPKPERRYLTAV